MYIYIIRHTLRDTGTITYMNGTLQGVGGIIPWVLPNEAINPVANGYDMCIGGYNNGWDCTNFEDMRRSYALANGVGVNGSVVGCFQGYGDKPSIIGMIAGDSHHAGTSATGGINNFVMQTTTIKGKGQLGRQPWGFASVAQPGARSDQIFAYLEAVMPAINPTYVVLPGWSANEPGLDTAADVVANDHFFGRLVQAADTVLQNGAIPIYVDPMPRDASFWNRSTLPPWIALGARERTLRDLGVRVIGAQQLLGNALNGALEGTYKVASPAITADNIHPNDVGHGPNWLAGQFMATIDQLVTAI
jgi:hypothetical protein